MRICLVARAGLELVTFRSQSRRFHSTPHMSTFNIDYGRKAVHCIYIFLYVLLVTFTGTEMCVLLDDNHLWRDYPCSYSKNVLCQIVEPPGRGQ